MAEVTAQFSLADALYRSRMARNPHVHETVPEMLDATAALDWFAARLADPAVVEAVAEALGEHAHEYERRCYPEHACSCGEWDGAFDDDGGPDDGQNDNAAAYQAHAATAAVAAITTALTAATEETA